MLNEIMKQLSPSGSVANRLINTNGNINCLRPYVGNDGRTYITVNGDDGKLKAIPINNTEASLRKDDWKLLDDAIIKAAKPRLKLVGDLRSSGLSFNIPNGMGKTVLESENVGDIGDASLSMDGIRQGANDRPIFDLAGLPLPIIHKDFNFSARQIMTSRNGGSALDTTTAELAARKVAEQAERMAIGVANDYAYAGYTVQGITSYDNRITRTITSPTASGWTPVTTLNELLLMRQDSQDAYYYGPWMLYVSTNWDAYIDKDYSSSYPGVTLRDRLKKVNGIEDVRTLDYMTGFDMVLVQMTSDVIREVVGMEITTVQWETQGGMLQNFKVLAILVPQLRTDQNDNTGIVHGSTV